MNKTYLIVGGTSVVSLAVGGAAGYLYSRKKFENTFEELVSIETAKTRQHFAAVLEEERAEYAALLERLNKSDAPLLLEAEDEDAPEQELSEADKEAIKKGRQSLARAGKALTDYKGFGEKPALESLSVDHNIFADTNGQKKPKKTTPPRGPGGKFLPKQKVEDDPPADRGAEQTPYLITAEDFLDNPFGYMQYNYKYFKQEDCIIDVENNNEAVDNDLIGEVNLTLFPDPNEEGYSAIYVRNEVLETDYEVRLVTESLVEFMGLGESDEELTDEYAGQ